MEHREDRGAHAAGTHSIILIPTMTYMTALLCRDDDATVAVSECDSSRGVAGLCGQTR